MDDIFSINCNNNLSNNESSKIISNNISPKLLTKNKNSPLKKLNNLPTFTKEIICSNNNFSKISNLPITSKIL